MKRCKPAHSTRLVLSHLAAILVASLPMHATPLSAVSDEAGAAPSQELPSAEMVEATTGSVTGRITWSGPLPDVEDFKVRVDRVVCAPRGGLMPSDRDFVNVQTLGLREAVVFIESRATLETSSPLEQERRFSSMITGACAITPRLQLIPQGGRVFFRNRDPVLHELHWRGPVPESPPDVLLAAEGAEEVVRFRKAGFYTLRCSRHPWESACVVVAAHRFYAISDQDGRFSLSGIPAGRCVLVVWHDGVRAKPVFTNGLVSDYTFSAPFVTRQRIVVEAGETLSLEIPVDDSHAEATFP